MKTLHGILLLSFFTLLMPLRALGVGKIQPEGFRSLDIRVEVLQSAAHQDFEALSKKMMITHEALMKDLQSKVATLFAATAPTEVVLDRIPAHQ